MVSSHHKTITKSPQNIPLNTQPGNTKGGSITVPLTSCLTGLDQSVQQIKTQIVSCHTGDSKQVNGTVILPLQYSPYLQSSMSVTIIWSVTLESKSLEASFSLIFVKQEVNGTMILPPLEFPDTTFLSYVHWK